MKVIFTFSDSSTYESSIIRQGFSCQEILFNRLQASDGFVGFSIPFSTTFSNKMTADINNNVLAVVYDDNNNPYATGFVKKEVGYEQKYRNQPIKITIVSKSYMLDKTLNESYALESSTSAQIVTWLLTQAGIFDIGSLSSMTTTVPLFVFNAGENIKDVLKEFCFEYSKTFYFDKNGYFQVADLFISSFTASQTFDRSNIRDKVNINVKEAEANCIRGRWTPLSLVSDTLVFEDKQNATSQYDCVIPIAANSWFGGVEDNFLKCDSTLGEVKYVKSITQNNIQSDSGIAKTLDLLERTSLNQLHFTAQNTTASVKNITKMQVYANAYIAKENRVDVTTYGNKEKELTLKYIQDQTTAQNFVKALADYYNSTSFTVSFSSDEVCDIGDLVTVSADGIGSFNCRIIQRTRNIITDTIDYVCENIGDYTPAVIVQTVQEPLAVNIAGGQKGLDGAPGTPGADGKNAITMTSATTPSGEYNGQMGFWQGQPYMWNGSSWVKQIGDLPTDAVLHYSFDEVPDYPDGSADVRLIDNNTYDIQSTNYQFKVNNNATISNSNGNVQISIIGASSSGVYITNSYITGKIIKLKLNVTAVVGTINVDNENGIHVLSITQTGMYEVAFLHTSNTQYPNFYIFCCGEGNSCTFTIEQIYIGDGSYATPIIDNVNGKNNATNNGGIAVQGVSGKSAYFLNGKYAQSQYQFDINKDFAISFWVKPDNNTTAQAGYLIRKNGQFHLLNGEITWAPNALYLVMWDTNANQIGNYLENTLLPVKWSMITLTRNGNKLVYYRDGIKVKEITINVTLRNNDNATNVCYSNNTRPQSIDDLQIFNRALSATEVLALYQNKANTPKYYDLSDYIVEGVDDDGIISPSEKEILYQKWIDIYAVLNGTAITASSIGQGGEYGKMISRATTAGVSLVTTGGEGKAYVEATEALRAGLWTTAYLQNMSVQTKVSAGTIDTLFNNYRTAYESLSIAIDVQNKATASALSISQSNSYHQVPTNSNGTPLSYVGTDNTVYLLEGSSKLTCVATGTTLTAGKWKITNITMTGCTSGTTKDNYTISDNGAVLGVLTGMTEQSAKRTFTIQFMGNNASTAETITVVQSFAKSQAGADGSTYKLLASANCVKTNTSVRFDAKKIVGESVSSYADGYLYSSTDGTTWTAKGQFKNGSAYASKNITVSVDTIFRLCLTESPSTNLVDELSVNIFRDGVDGQDGVSPTVTDTTMQYCQTATNVQPSSGWGNMPSSLTAGFYLWTKTTITYSDNSTAVSYSSTRNGNNGTSVTISSTEIKYQASSSGTTVPTGTWSDTVPSVSNGQYLWTRTIVNYSNGTSTTSYSIGYKGTNGINGNRGGQYLGASSTDPTSGIVSGDYYFNNGSGSSTGGYIRSYNGSSWSNETMNVSNAHVFEAINDIIAWVGDTTHSSLAIYASDQSIADSYIDKLLVGTAFINKLLVKKLHLIKSGQDIGAIYGGKYDENGNVDSQSTDTKGVYLDADGKLKCIDGEFEGTIQSGNYSQNTNGYKFDNDGNCYVNGKMTLSGSSEIEIQKSKYSGGDYIGIHSSNYSKSQAYGFNISAFSDGSSVTSIARFNNIDCKSISGWKRSDESSSYITFDANAFRITGSLGFAGITVIRLSDGYSTIRSKIKLLYDRYTYMLSSYIFVKGHYKITQVGQTGTIYEEDVCFINISIVNNNYRITTYNEKGIQAWFDIKSNGIDVVSPSSTYGFTINEFNFIIPTT